MRRLPTRIPAKEHEPQVFFAADTATIAKEFLQDWESNVARQFSRPVIKAGWHYAERMAWSWVTPFLITSLVVVGTFFDGTLHTWAEEADLPGNSNPKTSIDIDRNEVLIGLFIIIAGSPILHGALRGIKKLAFEDYYKNSDKFERYIDLMAVKANAMGQPNNPYVNPAADLGEEWTQFLNFQLSLIRQLLHNEHKKGEDHDHKLPYWAAIAKLLANIEQHFPYRELQGEVDVVAELPEQVDVEELVDAEPNTTLIDMGALAVAAVDGDEAEEDACAADDDEEQNIIQQYRYILKLIAQNLNYSTTDDHVEESLKKACQWIRANDADAIVLIGERLKNPTGNVAQATPFAGIPQVLVDKLKNSQQQQPAAPAPTAGQPGRARVFHRSTRTSTRRRERVTPGMGALVKPINDPRTLNLSEVASPAYVYVKQGTDYVAQAVRIAKFNEASDEDKNHARTQGYGAHPQDLTVVELSHRGNATVRILSHLRSEIKQSDDPHQQLKAFIENILALVPDNRHAADCHSFGIELTALLKDAVYFDHWQHFIQHDALNTKVFLSLSAMRVKLLYVLLSGSDGARFTALSILQDPAIPDNTLAAVVKELLAYEQRIGVSKEHYYWLAECSSERMIQFWRTHIPQTASVLVELTTENNYHARLRELFWKLVPANNPDKSIQLALLSRMRELKPNATLPLFTLDETNLAKLKQAMPAGGRLELLDHVVRSDATPEEKNKLYDVLKEFYQDDDYKPSVLAFIERHKNILLTQAVDALPRVNRTQQIDYELQPLFALLTDNHDMQRYTSAWFILFEPRAGDQPYQAAVTPFVELLARGFEVALKNHHAGHGDAAKTNYANSWQGAYLLSCVYERLVLTQQDETVFRAEQRRAVLSLLKALLVFKPFPQEYINNLPPKDDCQDGAALAARYSYLLLSTAVFDNLSFSNFDYFAKEYMPLLLAYLREPGYQLDHDAELLQHFLNKLPDNLTSEDEKSSKVFDHLTLAYVDHLFANAKPSIVIAALRGLFCRSYRDLSTAQARTFLNHMTQDNHPLLHRIPDVVEARPFKEWLTVVRAELRDVAVNVDNGPNENDPLLGRAQPGGIQ